MTAKSDGETVAPARARLGAPAIAAVAAAVGLVLTLVLVCARGVPLGVAGEWVWHRHSEIQWPFIEGIGLVAGVAVAVLAAWFADHGRSVGTRRALLVCVLAAGTWVAVQVLLAGHTGLMENIYAVLDHHTTGYLTRAVESEDDVGEAMRTYHAALEHTQEGGVHHLDVHPPGNVMLSWGVLRFARAFPTVAARPRRLGPYDVEEGLLLARKGRVFGELTDDTAVYDAACLLVVLMLAGLAVARAALLLASTRFEGEDGFSGVTALALLGVPAALLFLGHFDVLSFAWSGVCGLALCFAWTSLSARSRRLWWALAGLSCGVGVLGSLGYGVWLLLAGFTLALLLKTDRSSWDCLAAYAVGGLTVVALCYLFRVRIVTICFRALENNSLFHEQTGRSWRWALVNPVELLLTGGVPWLVLAAVAAWRSRREILQARPAALAAVPPCLLTAYLLVHPYCRGEFSRLALLFLPMLLLPALLILRAGIRTRRDWLLAAGAAALTILQTFAMHISLRTTFFH